jgi:eukaryotic-like serine/threonine-protein kinase
MAPEVAFDGKRWLISDLYSVGVVMYEMVTGTTPYQNPFEMLSGHQLVKPREHNGHTPPELERIILKALEQNPARRYQTCGQMLADVENTLSKLRSKVSPEGKAGRSTSSRVEFRPDSSSPLYYLEQAKRLMAEGNYHAAMEAAEVAVARSDEHPNYLRLLGGICLHLGYHHKALNVYQKLLATYDQGYPVGLEQLKDVLERLGNLFLTTQHYEPAIDVYERLVDLTQRNPYYVFKLAIVSGMNGNYKHAIELLEEVQQVRTDSVAVYSKLGWAYMAEGNVRQALSFYNQALILDSADLFSLYELGRYYLITGDRQRARMYFERLQINDKVGEYNQKVLRLLEG